MDTILQPRKNTQNLGAKKDAKDEKCSENKCEYKEIVNQVLIDRIAKSEMEKELLNNSQGKTTCPRLKLEREKILAKRVFAKDSNEQVCTPDLIYIGRKGE